MKHRIYTIGHSTHPIKEFIAMLKARGIEKLVDIRTVPGSRYNPQYGLQELEKSLRDMDIDYEYAKDLGGLRPKRKIAVDNSAWRNASFRNYADYMQSNEFISALESLVEMAQTSSAVIMCAEAVPWRCHRSLVGDALFVRGFEVIDIMSLTNEKEHILTSFAQVDGKKITYPGDSTDTSLE